MTPPVIDPEAIQHHAGMHARTYLRLHGLALAIFAIGAGPPWIVSSSITALLFGVPATLAVAWAAAPRGRHWRLGAWTLGLSLFAFLLRAAFLLADAPWPLALRGSAAFLGWAAAILYLWHPLHQGMFVEGIKRGG